MTMIEYLSAFFTGLGFGSAVMFAMSLTTLGGFMDSYREHLNKKIESGND